MVMSMYRKKISKGCSNGKEGYKGTNNGHVYVQEQGITEKNSRCMFAPSMGKAGTTMVMSKGPLKLMQRQVKLV
jgi:hypothetical protein